MSTNFELQRIEEKLEKLQKEQEQLKIQLPLVQRDESYEIQKLQREFLMKTNQIQSRLKGIEKEVTDLQRQKDFLKSRADREAEADENKDEEDGLHRRPFGLF